MSFVPLTLPPALEDPLVELIILTLKTERNALRVGAGRQLLVLLDASVSPGQLGTTTSEASMALCLGRVTQAQPGWKAHGPVCSITDRTTVPVTEAYCRLCLKLIWDKFGLPFSQRAPAKGCFEVKWMYMTDFIFSTDHRKTSRAQSK